MLIVKELPAVRARTPDWMPVILFLILMRLLLNAAAMIGAGWSPSIGAKGGANDIADFAAFPAVWAQWDSGYYLTIAQHGYSLHGVELAFFPAYPLLIHVLSASLSMPMVWSAFLISNLSFILAATLLWIQVRLDFSKSVAWATIISLSFFPTSFFFSAIYTESMFLLWSVLVYWFSARRRYVVAALIVSLASLTRLNGIFLAVIPLVEIVVNGRSNSSWRSTAGRLVTATCASSIGLALYGLYLRSTQGSPIAFLLAMAHYKRSITWPWETLLDSLAVVVTGHGGFQSNWFMRVISAADFLATSLCIACTVVSLFWLRKSLFAYAVTVMLFLLVSHGPFTLGLWSMSRYVLGVFPSFVVLGILLARTSRLKLGAWAISLILLCFMTAWFASGRWVA